MARNRTAFMIVIATLVMTGSATAQMGLLVTPTTVPIESRLWLPDRLAEMFRRHGHGVERKAGLHGNPIVVATLVRDQWRFVVEFEYTVEQRSFSMVCCLRPAGSLTQPRLLGLLEGNRLLAPPAYFSIRDGQLVLERPVFSTMDMSQTTLESIVDDFLGAIRTTHPRWHSGTTDAE